MKTRLLVGLILLAACGDPEGGGKSPEDSPGGAGKGGGGSGGDRDAAVPDAGDVDSGSPSGTQTCATTKCDVNATCSESGGTASCACKDGYEGDGKSCADVDECKTDNGGCDDDAACVNQKGSSRCLCDEGLTGDGKTCSPIRVDECGDPDLNLCDPNANCTDQAVGFACACPSGYDGDGFGCGDVDECTEGTDDCVANADCTNSFGSFSCACSPGYTGDGKSSCASLCVAALADVSKCDANGVCRVDGTMMGGTAVCQACKPGFVGDGVACTAAGDCPEACDGDGTGDVANSICTGPGGSRTCTCAPGYSGDGTTSCTDVDECATSNGGCGSATENLCTNLPGGAACSCQPGYAKDNTGTCVDVNECNLVPGPCHPNATCTNTTGSFTCACKSGFSGDGKVCSDVDECADGDDDCLGDGTARCVNTRGSFQCKCKRGYGGDGKTMCDDVDECDDDALNDCADTATCTNTTPDDNPFGYTCSCGEGQSGDGTECSDLNECENASLFDCPPNAACVNTPGSYDCECQAPFAGDDADACYCDLSGFWAMRQDLDSCWCDRDLLDVTIIGAGAVEASVWELHKYTYDGEKIVVEKKGCGTDNTPDLVSDLFGETYSSFIPNKVFDDFALVGGKTIPEAGIVPGSTFVTPNEAAVVGIDLGSDPEGAAWPSSSADGSIDWDDTDGDGELGFTLWPRVPSQTTDASTSSNKVYYAYPPVDLEPSGTYAGDPNERATCVSVATRVITRLDSDVESCERITGNVVNVKTEGRVRSCIKIPDNPASSSDLPPVTDYTCSADDWSTLHDGEGMRCDADDVSRLDDADQSQESQASFELVKIGALDDTVTCADVRAALPAIGRSTRSPIACSCP